MPLILPVAPVAPTLSNPATFETDCSAFLAWMKDVRDDLSGTVMVPGDFGIGGSAVNLTSAETFAAAENTTHVLGNASVSSVPTDAPTSGNAHVGLSLRSASARGMQMLASITGGSKALFWRAKDTTYSAWAKVYDSLNILGTVSQSGGIPTGAIIERGSNANGAYVRFADGTQICQSPEYTHDATTASGNVFTSGSQTWTYPAAFASGTVVSAGGATNDVRCWIAGNSGGSTSFLYAIMSSVSVSARQARLFAYGRWY
ncbi:hypothetical protein GCM10010991_07500 [Gemmobacter aquaticus]|uniref:Uncharacterized protein n=1 Tax=Gemmobacter aquaticus TaxID=490185 RepID=A0A918DB89_9RHOB|nr:hypothetical protein [Gemmobacter aquaticus]GGO26641.1 hypothetical protein GCM10010991_07500 [Gemmobacter aquaticus]